MRLRQIEVFHAIYTSGSMTNAARLLNVSQPSISKVLAHAEQQLGYPLFDRVKGKLVATPEADRLFGLVSNVYDHVEQLRQVAENLRSSDVGKVRVAATPAFGVDLLPTAISSYLAGHKDTEFEIETLHHDEINEALLASRIDIGLAFDAVPTPGLKSETIARGEFVVITPTDIDLGSDGPVRIEDIADLPFIGLSSRGPLGRLLTSYLEAANAARGSGVSIIDSVTARPTSGENIRCWPIDPPLQYAIDVITSDSMPPSILGKRFIEHIRQVVADHLTS
ncbi:MAG: LysR substrate-binding domain-containing protein [Woeseiaceae bacterium]